jgi:hypothetical protein
MTEWILHSPNLFQLALAVKVKDQLGVLVKGDDATVLGFRSKANT